MAPLADRPALTIAGYEIARLYINRGRSIYRAVRLSDGLPVVIKHSTPSTSRQHVALLRREFHILQRLQSVEAIAVCTRLSTTAMETLPWCSNHLVIPGGADLGSAKASYHWRASSPLRTPSPTRLLECMSSMSCTRISSRAASW